jgi:hypothetical protein
MSVRESSDAPPTAATTRFTRWPGLLRLSIDVLGAPVIALINQQAIYSGNMWACGHNAGATLHVAPALCFVAVLLTTIDSWLVYRAIGRGVEDEQGGAETRTRFLAAIGMMIGAISALVVLAQWLAIFTFGACMRA